MTRCFIFYAKRCRDFFSVLVFALLIFFYFLICEKRLEALGKNAGWQERGLIYDRQPAAIRLS